MKVDQLADHVCWDWDTSVYRYNSVKLIVSLCPELVTLAPGVDTRVPVVEEAGHCETSGLKWIVKVIVAKAGTPWSLSAVHVSSAACLVMLLTVTAM